MPFVAGKSGNPGGRPKENAEVKRLAQSHGIAAVNKLATLMESHDERIAVAACQAMLDRGFGKPHQSVAVDGDGEGGPIKTLSEVLLRAVDPQ